MYIQPSLILTDFLMWVHACCSGRPVKPMKWPANDRFDQWTAADVDAEFLEAHGLGSVRQKKWMRQSMHSIKVDLDAADKQDHK